MFDWVQEMGMGSQRVDELMRKDEMEAVESKRTKIEK